MWLNQHLNLERDPFNDLSMKIAKVLFIKNGLSPALPPSKKVKPDIPELGGG
jgi:hypothetical protein